jgi:two-component system, sensor histidine kinase RegB
MTDNPPKSAPDSDSPRHPEWQGDGAQPWDWAQARRGLRLRTLVQLRWVAVAGQSLTLLGVHFIFGIPLPLILCFALIALSAAVNLWVHLSWPHPRLADRWEATVQLGFDLVQLSGLLWLTGGLSNPFALLLISPVTVAAVSLPIRNAAILGLIAFVAAAMLAMWAAPMPWQGGPLILPPLYHVGQVAALVTGVAFTSAYAWQAQVEAQRMEIALAATQAVLEREQRLSALGGLAAAAAHELGTPLATIQVVTKEMARGLTPGTPLHEDVQLLISQAERCREILRRLSRSPDASDSHHARMSLSQLMDEVVDPHRGGGVILNIDVTCAPGASILEMRRMPEALHGLSAFVENAIDFAESAVEVTAYYDDKQLIIEVRDDGPGFSPDVINRLGEPYVTTRAHGEGSRSHHLGMGLGFFIAKTLLERTGAHVDFRNAKPGGASVSARWPRARVEAAPVV